MSHTTKIKSVVIKDVIALQNAVTRLQKQGVSIELKRNAKPRMFYQDQLKKHLNVENADYVLHLPKSKYDVGLVKNQQGEFDIYFDNWNGYVAQELGNGQGNDLGKFLQAYSIEAVTNAAIMQGYGVSGANVNAKGEVELELYV
jgi:hypothetical protein